MMTVIMACIMLFFFVSCGVVNQNNGTVPLLPDYHYDPYELPPAPDPGLPVPPAPRDVLRTEYGILRLSMRPPQTLNPLLNRDVSVARVLGLMFEPLAVLDEQLRPAGNLAQLDFSMDFTSVYVTIHSHALWSDGFPVTAYDLIFSVETLRNAPADAIYRNRVQNIADITRTGDRTALITFTDANPAVGYALLFPLIPRHYFQHEADPAGPRNMSPVGNGSFLFEAIQPMQSLQLIQNPHALRGLSAVPRVEVALLPDAQLDLYAFERGLTDAARIPVPAWARIPTVREVNAHIFPAMYFEFVGFNMGLELWHDMEVRQGVAHAFDADEIIATLYLHHAVRAVSPIHPMSWKADTAVRGFPYDPLRARVLLRDVPRDEPLVIIAGLDAERVAIAYRIAAGLYAQGFDVEVHALPDEAFLARLAAGDYDMYVGWVELCFTLDFAFLFPYDTELQMLFSAVRTAASEAAFAAAVSAFEAAFAERLPVLGLAFRHSAILTGTRISNDAPISPASVFLYANYWEIIR